MRRKLKAAAVQLDNADLIFPDGFRVKYPELKETAIPADSGDV